MLRRWKVFPSFFFLRNAASSSLHSQCPYLFQGEGGGEEEEEEENKQEGSSGGDFNIHEDGHNHFVLFR